MAKIFKTIRITAPREQVYRYMVNPRNLPTIWPSMVEVSNVKTAPDGAHSFSWVYKMAGLTFTGEGATTEVIPNEKIVFKNTKGILSTFTYRYSQEGLETIFRMEVEYTVPVPLIGKLAEAVIIKMNDLEANSLLYNLKLQMEEEVLLEKAK